LVHGEISPGDSKILRHLCSTRFLLLFYI